MQEIKITVDSIQRHEYFQSFHQSAKRIYAMLAVIMAVICGVIIVATGNASLPAFLGPMLIFCAVLVLLEIVVRRCYKDELVTMDPVEYTIGPVYWTIQRGEEKVDVKWKTTPKLKFSKDCMFIYNTDTSSNMIPRRLVSPEQEAQIRAWFKDTRVLAKEYEREQLNKDRAEFREKHPGLRLGRRGPGWGPFRKK